MSFRKAVKVVVRVGADGHGKKESPLIDSEIIAVMHYPTAEGASSQPFDLRIMTTVSMQLVLNKARVQPGSLFYPTCERHGRDGAALSALRGPVSLIGQETVIIEVNGAEPHSKVIIVIATGAGPS